MIAALSNQPRFSQLFMDYLLSRNSEAQTLDPTVRRRMTSLGLDGIPRLETQLLLALADELTQVFRYDFSELIDSSFRMLGRT